MALGKHSVQSNGDGVLCGSVCLVCELVVDTHTHSLWCAGEPVSRLEALHNYRCEGNRRIGIKAGCGWLFCCWEDCGRFQAGQLADTCSEHLAALSGPAVFLGFTVRSAPHLVLLTVNRGILEPGRGGDRAGIDGCRCGGSKRAKQQLSSSASDTLRPPDVTSHDVIIRSAFYLQSWMKSSTIDGHWSNVLGCVYFPL